MVSTLNEVENCQIWFLELPQKMFRFPYFREEGGGQEGEGYKNFLIFYFHIREGEVGGPSKLGQFPY